MHQSALSATRLQETRRPGRLGHSQEHHL